MSALQTEEVQQRILYAQHLTAPAEIPTVCRDMNGLQAQFLSHARHALRIRHGALPDNWTDGLVKSWTLRGTMHVFCRDDLPLFLHTGRSPFLRAVDGFETDGYITAERKWLFAGLLLQCIREGADTREELKERCFAAGMTETEAQSVFNGWGGLLRALAETGRLTHKLQEKKAFALCEPFAPMEKDAAETELTRRYFAHYGPATVRDAAYYFGIPQAEVKRRMQNLSLSPIQLQGQTRWFIDGGRTDLPSVPACVFLAGFDPLLLGYQKQESLFLPPEHLRGIFNLAGIVFPAVLLHGRIKAKWKRTGRKLLVTPFEALSKTELRCLYTAAEQTFGKLQQIVLEDVP